MDVRKVVIGDKPWAIFNFTDFMIIGLFSILFMQVLQITGMGIHRFTLWRVTGSARSPQPLSGSPLATAKPIGASL